MLSEGICLDVYSYGILFSGFVKCGKLLDVLKVFDEMFERGVMGDIMCYNILIDGYLKFCDVEKVYELWD